MNGELGIVNMNKKKHPTNNSIKSNLKSFLLPTNNFNQQPQQLCSENLQGKPTSLGKKEKTQRKH